MKWSICDHLTGMVNATYRFAVIHIAFWFLLVRFGVCSDRSHRSKAFSRKHVDVSFVLPPDTQKLSFSPVIHLTLSKVSSSDILWHALTVPTELVLSARRSSARGRGGAM